jgi:vanillate O-demethylase ferredoxin subunit
MLNELSVAIVDKCFLTDEICMIELADPAGEPLPPFTAGAHIDVHVTDTLVRQYSLCDLYQQTASYRIAVLREGNSRGGSAAIHDALAVGDRLRIGRPRNNFPLVEADGRVLLFAGGHRNYSNTLHGAAAESRRGSL